MCSRWNRLAWGENRITAGELPVNRNVEPEVTPNLSQLKSFPAIMLRTNERARTGGSLEFLERGQRVGQLEDLIVRHAQTLMDAVGVAHMSEGSCLLVGLFRGVGDSRFTHTHIP